MMREPDTKRTSSGDSDVFLDSVVENIPNMVFVKDATDLRFVTVNRAAEELLGISRGELIGKSDHDVFPKEQADFFTAKDRAVLAGREPVDIPEEPIATPHKGQRILHTKKVPILGRDGTPRFLLGISEDITELKQVESQLRESERQLRGLLEAIPDLIFRIDRSGRFLAFVPAKGISTLTPEADFIGRRMKDVMPGPIAARAERALEETFERNEAQTLEYELGEMPEQIHFEARLVPTGTEVVALVRDVSERKRAEDNARQQQRQLAHAGRISAMGEMATGLAHELNQPLAAILNHADACTLSIRGGDAQPESILSDLEAIASQAVRATQIIRHLRNFVRKSGRSDFTVDLNEVTRDTLEFLSFEARAADVSIETDLVGDPLLVSGDPVELQQVVFNLVRNAIEAMSLDSRGGTVWVSSERADGAAEVLIRDEGEPLSGKTPEDFFAPYFSTKANGLGLGLSIGRSIVEAHGGSLVASANPGRGATFRIRIPLELTENKDD